MIRPILFNTQMVQAILDKRKKETRRLVSKDIVERLEIDVDGMIITYIDQATGDFIEPLNLCKYQKGDILWVRETWSEWTDGFAYKVPAPGIYNYPSSYIGKWHPSIHMPKEAARIFLKVTNIRIKRLQSMSINDFLNEGIEINETAFNDPENAFMQARSKFIELWDSTLPPNKNKHQPSFGAWSTNTWVWVIEFEPCEKPEGWPK